MTKFKDLPSVLIQDPRAQKAYLIPSRDLPEHEMTLEKLVDVEEGVVTFSIPDNNLIEITPPFNATGTECPAIIIQHGSIDKAYFFTYGDIQAYAVEQPSDYGGYGVSFVIPAGNEFLEDLSPVQYAMLQSNERGSRSTADIFVDKPALEPALVGNA